MWVTQALSLTLILVALWGEGLIVVGSDMSSVHCRLQGATMPPVFSKDGDFVIGGIFSIHYYLHTLQHKYTSMPAPLKCTGRSVKMERDSAKMLRIVEIVF